MIEGYLFIPNRCRKYQSDIVQTRLLGQKAICLSGVKSAKIFYDNARFTRKGAAPKRIQKTLFGKKGVQTLDGEEHRIRKQMFTTIMTPSHLEQLIKLVDKRWALNSKCWEKKNRILLFDEAQLILCQAACQWAGVPLKRCEARQKAQDFGTMVDAFGGAGPRYWRGKCARKRSEQWIRRVIEAVRDNRLDAPSHTALYQIAWHHDSNGFLLSPQVAAVELINILRPIIAIATYITFGALAIKRYPECLKNLRKNDETYTHMFVQEVRRFYPFGPFVGARVRNTFDWHRYTFKKGTLVLLDLYGTNHDPRLWVLPNQFLPERFQNRVDTPYDFIPQGGGDLESGHRCPGEWITIEIMKVSMNFLANHLNYEVPAQDLNYSLTRMPTLPNSRFVMTKIRRKIDLEKSQP
jgi:fatty-acid peroxygenase